MTDLEIATARASRHLALTLRPIQLATVGGVAYAYKGGRLYKDGARQPARQPARG